jgi:hypothetical protein
MIKRLLCMSALLAGLCSIVVLPSASAQATITQVGWWSQRPGASELPQGGFELAFAPTGQLSRAALRIQIDAAELTSALLELTESEAAGAEVAAVTVCPTSDPWAPANPGAWEDAPEPNCAQNVPLSRRSTGEWAGDISELLGTGTVSIVLVPMSHADTQGVPIPYQIVFSKATLRASGPTEPQPAPSPSSFADLAPPPAQPRIVAPPDTRPSGGSTGPPPVVVEREGEADNADGSFDPPLAADDDGGRPKPWWRVAILVPVAALLGAGAVFARRTANERGWTG